MSTETLLSPAYFVSPVGRDTWSGRLAEPNADGTDGPFATLTKARDAMRATGIATTYVRQGTYAMTEPLRLTAQDSNHQFVGYPGETAVLSGGEAVGGFRDEGNGLFSAAVPGGPTGLDLSIDGVRQRAAQSGAANPATPVSGFFWADQAAGGPSKRAFTFQEGDIRPGDVQAGTKVQVFDRERLTDDIVTVASVDFASHTVTLASDTWYPLRNGSTYRLLNNAGFVRNPGEFGWRASDGRLVVKPQDPANFARATVVVARRGTLIDIDGATGVTLQGLTFSDTAYNGGAVLRLTNASGNRIGSNQFVNVGTAMSLVGSSNNLIGGNTFSHLGASGIDLTAGSNGNRVYANSFEHVGDVAKYVAAISGSGISGNVIANNDIAWSARDGIAIKNWSAGTKNTGNVVEYNRIAHTGQETADAAAISVLGRSNIDTGMVIRGNRIEDANGVATSADHHWLTDYKGFGIYLDDQTNGVSVTGNFSDNADWGAVFIHGGDDNRVNGNVAVLRSNQQELVRVEWVPQAGDAGVPRNNAITGNIAYGAQTVDDYWKLLSANNPTVGGNLVFNSSGRNAGDVVGDPGFLDPARGDWRLGSNSPALAMGIGDLQWRRMGKDGYVADGATPAFWTVPAGYDFAFSSQRLYNDLGLTLQAASVGSLSVARAADQGDRYAFGLGAADQPALLGSAALAGTADPRPYLQTGNGALWANGRFLEAGQNPDSGFRLQDVTDYDGNHFPQAGAWELQGHADVNRDGRAELVLTNSALGRWMTLTFAADGSVDTRNVGRSATRVVGVYEEPIVENRGTDFDSARRFEDDLRHSRLELIGSGDTDGDGIDEVWFVQRGDRATTADDVYLRALMHDDGNIRYANYMSAGQTQAYAALHGAVAQGNWMAFAG